MNFTARQISLKLNERAEQVCKMLLPNGKLVNGEWCAGSLCGEAGQSLKVRASGEKVGVWKDFAGSDSGGDLLDLWAQTKRISLGTAIREAKGFLGIREPQNGVPEKIYSKPKTKVGIFHNGPIQYLKNERLISPETIKQFRIGANEKEIIFPSFNTDGELVNVKYIGVERDQNGKKIIRQENNCPPSLFGWQALSNNPREVVITEGQIDAMTWHQWGFPALSIPNGTGDKFSWLEYDWENLQQFDSIYLSFDMDKPGREAVIQVANRLGIHRCFIVELPHNDANECLQKGVTANDASKFIAWAKPIIPEEIKTPNQFTEEVLNVFYPKDDIPKGLFPDIFRNKIGFRPGELTIWTGISSHGKSVMLNQVMILAAMAKEKCAIASMEMRPEQTLARMITCIELKTKPPKETISHILNWLTGRIWIYDVMGNVSKTKLLDLMDYSFCRHGINHFVIDSLMKCNVDSEDYNGQRMFADALATFAKRHNVHIHLVAHPRKTKDESEVHGKMDIKGSSDLFNQADNVITVWRNKDKEAKLKERKISEVENQQIPDCIVYCDKQRETGWEGKIPLWYLNLGFRFCYRDGEIIAKEYELGIDPQLAYKD